MRGLFERDFRSCRRSILYMCVLTVVLVAVEILALGEAFNPESGAYLFAFAGAASVTSIFGFDEQNRYAFYRIFPLSAAMYVITHMLFVISTQALFWLLARITLAAEQFYRSRTIDARSLLTAGIRAHFLLIVLAALLFAIMLKFGKKGLTTFMFAVIGIMLVVLVSLSVGQSFYDRLYNIIEELKSVPRAELTWIIVGTSAVVSGLLSGLCVVILKNKEM